MFKKKSKNIPVEAGGSGGEKSAKKLKTKSKKKKRIIIAVIVLTVLGAAGLIPSLLNKGTPPAAVTAGVAEILDLEQIVTVNGVISGSESAEIVSAQNLEITSILAQEGDGVKKGQVLATLDGESMADDYRKALKALEESQYNYESAELLYEEGAISKTEYIRAKSTYENDKITVSSFDIAGKTTVRSPISGTVTRVNVSLGRYAKDTEGNKPMFVVEDLEHLTMKVKISEHDISKIKLGQSVTISADVLGKGTAAGTVSRISPTGELKDAASKEMVIPVTIDVTQSDAHLIAGVAAKAKILIESRPAVLTVPIDAVLEDPDTGESFVFTVVGSVLKKVIFVPGIEGDFKMEVLEGPIKDGDQVVLSPTFDLSDGTEVLVSLQ